MIVRGGAYYLKNLLCWDTSFGHQSSKLGGKNGAVGDFE
jgi:hypothetical protein